MKQAVEQAISDTVVKGLSSPTIITAQPLDPKEDILETITENLLVDIVNPDNERIITTVEEQQLYRIITELFSEEDLIGKDTESYYSVLYQNKSNRWLFRYDVNRKRPTIQFIIPMNEQRQVELERAGFEVMKNGLIFLDTPQHIYRAVGILRDSLDHCAKDENFKRATSS